MTSTNQSFVKDNFFKGNYIDIKDGKIYMYNFKENKSKIIELFKLQRRIAMKKILLMYIFGIVFFIGLQ